MKIELTRNKELAQEIKSRLKAHGGYCPCVLDQNPDTKCMCRDFKENITVGEYCHCGLYKKISE